MLVFLMVALLSPAASSQEKAVLFHEDFDNLDNWTLLTFPKIKNHTAYSIERIGDRHYLKAESNASASAIVYKNSFNVYDYPGIRWRWKLSNVYVKGDPRRREGDDYPIRVYVMFEYDPDTAGAFEKIKYGLAKKLYGEYPPHSSLGYVWANREGPETIVTSPYTVKAKMIFLEKGTNKVRTWQDEEVDVLVDYQKAFGVKPPQRARIAVMNDSDDTGERSTSYMEFIEVFKQTLRQ
jgi:hypothetical protein